MPTTALTAAFTTRSGARNAVTTAGQTTEASARKADASAGIPAANPPLGRRLQRGLTLVECCVTMAVTATLAGMAAPSMSSLLGLARDDVAASLRASLQLARSEAIKTRARAVVCRSADGHTCADSGGWGQGWIVFRDANNNAQREPEEALVWASSALPQSLVFSGNGSVARYVSFEPDGSPAQTSGAFQAGTLTICQRSDTPTPAHTLVLSAAGRIRLQSATVPRCA